MNTETAKIFKTAEQVKTLLTNYPEYRDNDERLVSTFWYKQLKNRGRTPEAMGAMDFMRVYSEGLLTSADTIVRARAKLQQEDPSLRGEKWAERHDLGRGVTREINRR